MRTVDSDSIRLSQFANHIVAEFSSLRKIWGWFLVEGIALVVLGLIAISASTLTTLVSVSLIGWLLLVGGIIHAIHAFSAGKWGGVVSGLFTGVLYAVAGFLTIRSPAATAMMLTFLLAPLFIVGGIVRIIMAMTNRYPQWGWSVFSGLMALVLGVMIWNQWPNSGFWVIGTFVGIEMFFSGFATCMFSIALKNVPVIENVNKVAA